MTDLPIPLSLKITPQEARERIRTACQSLVDTFGQDRVAYRLGVDPNTVRNWRKGTTEPRFSLAIQVIAWYDMEINSTPCTRQPEEIPA